MPRQTEPNANNAIGSLLQAMLPRSQVRSEHTQAIYGHPGLQPDILITAPGRAPVVIEAEYMPAASVEPEAKERLGLETESDGREIEAAIALRYPNEVSEGTQPSTTLCRRPACPTASSPRTAARVASRSPAGWTAPLRTWPTWFAWSPSRSTP